MVYFVVLSISLGIIVLSFFLLEERKAKLHLEEEEKRLKELLDQDNNQLKSIVNNSRFLDDNFKLKTIGKRLVGWGMFDGILIILKYKKGKALLGIPTTLNTGKKYFNLIVDLEKFDDKKDLPGLLGAENYFQYTIIEYLDEASITRAIHSIKATLVSQLKEEKVGGIKRLRTIEEYESLLKQSGEVYM